MNKHQKLVQQQFLNDEETVIKRLKKIYAVSLNDITNKAGLLQDDIDDLDKLAKLAISQEEKEIILSRRRAKVYQKQYQESLKKQVNEVLDKMSLKQFTTVSDYLTDCYDNGFIGTMFDLQGQGIPLCFPLDQEQVVRAVQLESKISKGLYSKLGEDVSLLKRKIAAQVSRGIATGMSHEQVAKQLAGTTNIGFNNAVRIARTEGHRIQCQAGMDACYKAKEKGADVLKQWDATMDSSTRESHVAVDGEIRELDKPFSNGLMFPGDPSGGPAEVINCRCALLQRASWELDEKELEALKKKAEYYGIDKTDNFNEFKDKYLKAAKSEPAVTPKKQYLTEKKLKSDIADIEEKQKLLPEGSDEWQQLEDLKADYQEKLNEKLVAKETKKLKKEQMALQKQLDAFDDTETFGGIWYGQDDITIKDWQAKQSSIQKKIDYYEEHIKNASLYGHTQDDIDKFNDLLAKTKDFDKKGQAYWKTRNSLDNVNSSLTNIQNNGKISKITDDAYSQARKDGAWWFTEPGDTGKSPNPGKGLSVPGADGVLRDKSGEVWRNASQFERDSIYEYTMSYSKFNEPLRGIEYGTNKYLGVGNVDLDMIGVNGYGGFKRGEVRKQIDAMTSIIEKSTYADDFWVQRGCGYGGMDKFFGINANDFNLPEADLAKLLVGSKPTEYGFFSTGVSKGKGFSHKPIILNVYAPSGTKMMYVEPFSHYGAEMHNSSNKFGLNWNGFDKQKNFGDEAEMIFQRDTQFKVTKVEKNGGKIYIDMEVIKQEIH